MPDRLQALHEDADLLVLEKPAGLLCVPGRGPDKQDCLSARAQQRWPDALIVHRLDMATSGLVLMARNAAAHRTLSAAFAERRVEKKYEAVVDGLLPASADWALIDAPLIADWPRRPLQKIDPDGKPSQTRWRVLRALAHWQATHLELEPITGRSHQLRVHLASIGHAILGDAFYADASALARMPRLMLHATALAFAHPVSGAPLQFESATGFDALLDSATAFA